MLLYFRVKKAFIAFLLAIFGAISVQKNTRDSQAVTKLEGNGYNKNAKDILKAEQE